jgi:hypothetical protein
VLVVLGHLALVAYFVSLPTVFGDQPIAGDDYDLHIGQVWLAVEGFAGWGQSWVYDTSQLAGIPANTISDSGSKAWELWTFALVSLGVPKAIAFNLWILFAHLFAPVFVYAASRLFGLAPRVAWTAAAMASLVWFFDSFAHWLWWVGMVSYALAAAFLLIPLALFHRLCERWHWGIATSCGLTLGLALLVHPYVFFALLAPMLALYLRVAKTMPRAHHVGVGAIALLAISLNLWWLRVSFAHWHYILDSGFYGQAGLTYLVADFFNLLVNPTDTGVIGTRAAFRFLIFALAGVGIALSWRQPDRLRRPLLVGIVVALALVYLGGYIPGARQIQPYRFVLAAAFMAVIPAAVLVERAWRERWFAELSLRVRALVLIMAVFAAQHLASDVMYYFPGFAPKVPDLIDGAKAPLSSFGYPGHLEYRLPHHPVVQAGTDDVVEWVRGNIPAGDRVLVDSILLGERMAWSTDVEVIGGFTLLNITHARANFFRRWPDGGVPEREVWRYLKTFGINWVVLGYPREDLEFIPETLRKVEEVKRRRIYRTTARVDVFLGGRGRVEASTNRIVVRGSVQDEDVVIAYHWHEALVCEPDCRVERQEHDLDDVGFIRVPAPHPSDFAIVNGYSW